MADILDSLALKLILLQLSDTGSVLFLLELVCLLWLCVRAEVFIDDVPCIYDSDPRTRGCACLSYFHK